MSQSLANEFSGKHYWELVEELERPREWTVCCLAQTDSTRYPLAAPPPLPLLTHPCHCLPPPVVAEIVHVTAFPVEDKKNLYAQVTVRFHNRQILAVYDRKGRVVGLTASIILLHVFATTALTVAMSCHLYSGYPSPHSSPRLPI